MADDARRTGDDLTAAPAPEESGFFALLRRLEAPGRRFGCAGGPEREPARLGQPARMSFATRDVAHLQHRRGGAAAPPAVEVEVIGLLGPEGPMPLHLTRRVFERASQRWFEAGSDQATADTAPLDFCNLLQHRMIALYWRAWAEAELAAQAERPGGGRVGAMLAAMAGIGLPGLRPPTGPARATEALKLDHARRIASGVRGRDRLTVPLADLFGAPVLLREFVPGWIDIPPRLQTRLGQAHARLGQGAVAGARSFSRQHRAEVRVGPVSLAAYRRIADDRALRRSARHLALQLAGPELRIDLRPVLMRDEVPAPRLGAVALGRTAWLPTRRPSDRDDLLLPAITEAAA